MNLTVTTIAKSLADYLAPCFPSVAFYEDPNQQGSIPPCMFLQTRYNYTTWRPAGSGGGGWGLTSPIWRTTTARICSRGTSGQGRPWIC